MCDEAHALSAAMPDLMHALIRLRCRCRLLLTAAPVTSDLTELWSLCHLARPGCAGDADRWRNKVVAPLEVHVADDRSPGVNVGKQLADRARQAAAREAPAAGDSGQRSRGSRLGRAMLPSARRATCSASSLRRFPPPREIIRAHTTLGISGIDAGGLAFAISPFLACDTELRR